MNDIALDGFFIELAMPPYNNESGQGVPAPHWRTYIFVVDRGFEPPTAVLNIQTQYIQQAQSAMYMEILGSELSQSARHAVQDAWLEVAGTDICVVEVEPDALAEWSPALAWEGAAAAVERSTA